MNKRQYKRYINQIALGNHPITDAIKTNKRIINDCMAALARMIENQIQMELDERKKGCTLLYSGTQYLETL